MIIRKRHFVAFSSHPLLTRRADLNELESRMVKMAYMISLGRFNIDVEGSRFLGIVDSDNEVFLNRG